jgi:hypothetical protein
VSATATGVRRVPRGPLRPLRDALAVAGRNLIAYRRVPQLLVFSTIQPVIFVLLFRYVFGGAVQTPPGVPYVDYLMPGIFVQTTVFGAIGTAVGLATDLKSGLLERFRSLPMARSAVLAGRTLADLTRNVFVTALMVLVGFAVGFRVHTGALEDRPYGAGPDAVSEATQLAVDAAVAPSRVLPGQPQHQIPDLRRRAGAAAAVWIGPVAPNQVAMPAQQRGRLHEPSPPDRAWQ